MSVKKKQKVKKVQKIVPSGSKAQRCVLVGTYKKEQNQLKWIGKRHLYNYPLSAEEAQLSGAQFISSDFHGAYFTHSDCTQMKIRDSDFSGASFQNCCIDNADFGDTELDEQQKRGCMDDRAEWEQANNLEIQPSM